MKKITLFTLFSVSFFATITYAVNINFETIVYSSHRGPAYIYNGSDRPWTVSFSFITGGVNNINDVNQYSNNFTLTIEPHQQKIPLFYRRSKNASISGSGAGYSLNGKVTITDFENKSQCYLIKGVDGIWTRGAWIESTIDLLNPVIRFNSNMTTREYGDIMLLRDSWSSAPPQTSFGPTC